MQAMTNAVILILLALLAVVNGFSPSPEYKALRGIEVVSAKTSLAVDVSKLVVENDPNESVLICFRSFG